MLRIRHGKQQTLLLGSLKNVSDFDLREEIYTYISHICIHTCTQKGREILGVRKRQLKDNNI